MKLKTLLAGTLILASSLFAENLSDLDTKVLQAEKKKLYGNRNIKINNVTIDFTKELPNNWKGYVFKVDYTVKKDNKRLIAKDMVFSNGTEITNRIESLNTGMSYENLMHPKLGTEFHQDKFIIAGNKDAKHKVVVFSDPLCPYCQDIMPKLVSDASSNPKDIALYYISLPLVQIHPTASTIIRASLLARKDGIKDVEFKVYASKLKNYPSHMQQEALNGFNKLLGTKYTMDQINTKEIIALEKEEIDLSTKAMVSGTPTVYLDGERDNTRRAYEKYIR